jgi:hypothetical protein
LSDLLALTSSLLSTLNNLEHRMQQLQADRRLLRYVAVAHALSTRLNGRLLDRQGARALARLAAELPEAPR